MLSRITLGQPLFRVGWYRKLDVDFLSACGTDFSLCLGAWVSQTEVCATSAMRDKKRKKRVLQIERATVRLNRASGS